MKKCKRCNLLLDISEFYTHPHMADGRLNFCKACVKTRVQNHRTDNLDAIREYDRSRGRSPERLFRNRRYRAANRELVREVSRSWYAKHPEKKRAHTQVKRAIEHGILFRVPCWCGDPKSEAHHPDYSKPLEVVWLCDKHHKEIHREFREQLRQQQSAAQ